ncbi:class I SAM-dependent RNA methyltransferase [Thalassospira tepidiphila]|jgi:23S rRNA (uracil1939-C5)-methyltransferase|uniref:class I SAM-dependent RNA methyltransferase n=1 Tax=Thalassospira TaxID=168934 RepID=UPI000EDFEBCE|nr:MULTISPECIES: methyltransferase [Thalassospira]MBS8273916.1 class I SAM-dependent RNA methyltransferase [Thalassospira tepidiphila]HAI28448.1 class I SAM-dependent RNA methyltransferase [Thalassospira sp.]|tara:strand:- start:2626 stop:4017 length:1392 start_codon:yes stop_codon:yes gene_type:complete
MKHHNRNPRARGGRKRQPSRRDPLIGFEADVTVEQIGARGDGIAHVAAPDGKSVLIYVDCVLPGDKVRVALRQKRGDGYGAEVVSEIARSDGYSAPRCAHFKECGGCALQHMNDDDYRSWKRDKAIVALQRAGIDPQDAEGLVGDVEISPPASRRRAGFSVHVGATGVFVGFHGRFSHTVLNVPDCAVLRPELMTFRKAFVAFLEACPPAQARDIKEVFVTLTDTGLDVLVHASNDPDLDMRQDLAAFADDQNIARLSWKTGDRPDEPLAARHTPVVHFENIDVPIAPGGFLQATSHGEEALVRAIKAAVVEIAPKNVADLFCGVGSFTFSLALAGKRRSVTAVESDPRAVELLQYAVGQSGSPIKVMRRDLFRQPLVGDELTGFDLVVFDPPRAGALAQCEALAADGPEWVIAVSCNPATFSRDMRVLRNSGYEIEKVVPVDQFLWSSHLEIFAILRRRSNG